MNIEILTEQEGNPFIFYKGCMSYWHANSFVNVPFFHFESFVTNQKIKKSVGRDYHTSVQILTKVMNELLLNQNISPKRVLEVGAGHVSDKIDFFLEKGCEVYALDVDETELHDKIKDMRKNPCKGIKRNFIPYRIGEAQGAKFYQGDIGFINNVQSELKRTKFDLVLFYGSIFGLGGNSRCVSQNRQTSLMLDELSYYYSQHPEKWKKGSNEFKDILKYNLSLQKRLTSALNTLSYRGKILIIPHTFTSYIDSSPESIRQSKETNLNLLSLLEEDTKIKIFGLTKSYLKKNLVKQGYAFKQIDLELNKKSEVSGKIPELLKETDNLGSIDVIMINI